MCLAAQCAFWYVPWGLAGKQTSEVGLLVILELMIVLCVSSQELLPEEILRAVLVGGEGERRCAGRWKKCIVVPPHLGTAQGSVV